MKKLVISAILASLYDVSPTLSDRHAIKGLGMSSFLIFVLVQAAIAGTPPPGDPAPTPAEKKICRNMVMTGSIMPKHSCRTAAEWAKLQASTDAAWEMARRKRGFTQNSQVNGFD